MRNGLLLALLGAATAASAQTEPPVRGYPDRVVDIQSVTLSVDARGAELQAHLRAAFSATERGVLQFAWPTHGLTIDSVFVTPAGGDTALSVVRGDSLIVSLSEGLDDLRTSFLDVWYRVLPGAGFAPPDPDCCLITERRWLPIPDDPGDRFRVPALDIAVPDGWSVPTAQALADTSNVYRITPARAVHLQQLGFVAGPFEAQGEDAVVLHLAPGTDGDADRLRDDIAQAHAFFERRTGFRLPWQGLAVALVPGSSERVLPGLLILSQQRVRSARSGLTDQDLELAAATARQWTHIALAPDWWAERWVGEALAGAMALSYLADSVGPAATVEARFALMAAYLQETRSFRRPLVWDRYVQPEDLLDLHALAKAPLVMYRVLEFVGESAFWADVRRLLARHGFEAIDSGILLEVLEPDGPGPVAALFDTWVFAAGHPELQVAYRWDADAEHTVVEITQTQEGPLVPSRFPLQTEIEWLPFGEPDRAAATLDEREATVALNTGFAPRYVTLDPDGLLIAEVHPPPGDIADVSARLRYGGLGVRLRAAADLSRVAADPAAGITLRLALQQEERASVRARLAAAAASLPPSASLTSLLATLLEDFDPAVRHAAIGALVSRYPEGDADGLIEAVAQRDTAFAVQAAAVSSMRGPGAEGLARAALITPSEEGVVRAAGLAQLVRLGVATAADFLTHTAPESPAEFVRDGLMLADGLETTRPLRIRVLELLGARAWTVRWNACRQAGHLLISGNRPAVERLAEMESHAGVRGCLEDLAAGL
ncbi:MAG: hypothetical protein JJ896_13660 [Rhodothermales bacterium]|nr:hypothetical protein [Rhodothermales bacterium]MBO6780695.1 hypothetical protein [Rhodothermales bacterium]